MIGLVIAQGESAVEHPQGHGVIEGSPPLDGNLGSRNQAHLPDTAAQLAADLDRLDHPGLLLFHVPQGD